MVCKKCGCDTLMGDGDWLECPECGAKYFNTEIDTEISATEKIEQIENNAAPENSSSSEKKTEEEKKEEKKPSKLKETIDFILPIVIAVIVALLLKTFVFANAVVPTGSMTSTINAGDRIIASRIAYISDSPERYDIIMFSYPDDETTPFVKRVIGMPGDTVSVTNGIAYITDKNGNVYQTDQSFIKYETPVGEFGPYYVPEKGETITTEDAYCYAENGMRVGGTAFLYKYCEKQSDGTYVVADNLYFCMGDNRNDSLDSRYWTNKYVAESKIIGKVMFRYYPGFENLN